MHIIQFWKRLKYWQKGLLIGIFIWIAMNVYFLISMVQSYNGYCGSGIGFLSFGSSSHNCSLSHYLFFEPFEDGLTRTIMIFEFFIYTVPLVIIGYIVDLYKRRKQKGME